jgi:hypothetical protein
VGAQREGAQTPSHQLALSWEALGGHIRSTSCGWKERGQGGYHEHALLENDGGLTAAVCEADGEQGDPHFLGAFSWGPGPSSRV